MGIDKETKIKGFNIVFDDRKDLLDEFRKQAEEDSQNESRKKGELKKLSITDDNKSFETEEYYFDKYDNSITVSGQYITSYGNIFVNFNIPLSDTVLIDIIEHSIKKLNKLKLAMEALK